MTLLGFDISLWNDDNSTPQMVDFEKAKNAGIQYAFIKVSQACYSDPDYAMNWNNAKIAGMPRGGYHFLDWSKPAKDQADFFWGMLKNDPGEISPVLDYECRKNAPPRATAHKAFLDFIGRFEAISARRLIIYTGWGYWNEFGYTVDPVAADHKLWVANYGVSTPNIPKPWTSWLFWQYTDKGPGLQYGAESVDLDLNYYNGDAAQFTATFGVEPATPGEVTPPPVTDAVKTIANVNIRNKPLVNEGTKIRMISPGWTFDKAGVPVVSDGYSWQPVKAYMIEKNLEDV